MGKRNPLDQGVKSLSFGSVNSMGDLSSAGGNIIGDITGSNRAADAAQSAAQAQLAEARNVRNQAMGIANTMQSDVMQLAQASPQELRAYEGQLASSQRTLANQEKLLNSIDPALMEASQQILNIMQGKQTSVGGQYEGARGNQRQQLINQLREQYGPGAETSSIGQKALRQFDAQTTEGGIGLQNQSLSTLFGALGQGSALQGAAQQGAQGLGAAGQNFSNIQNRLVNSRMGVGQSTLAALTGTSQPVIESSGANYVGELLRGQAQQQFFRDQQQMVGQVAGSAGGAMMASDIRLKKDIKQQPTSLFEGVPTYKFRYRDERYGKGVRIGVMAQDLLAIDPKHPAVSVNPNGYYMVDYAKVPQVRLEQ